MKAGFVTVGETLSHARRTRGLSVDDVAADTRIRATLIHAIEADNFDPCGGAVYARGHIRSIARVVGADPEPLISEFDTAHGVETVAPAAAAQPTDHSIVARSERRAPNWTAAMAAALVVICALALVGLLRHGGSANKAPASPKTVAGTAPTTTPKPRSSPPPSSVAALPSTQAARRRPAEGLHQPAQHRLCHRECPGRRHRGERQRHRLAAGVGLGGTRQRQARRRHRPTGLSADRLPRPTGVEALAWQGVPFGSPRHLGLRA
jgi:hypothetical protein